MAKVRGIFKQDTRLDREGKPTTGSGRLILRGVVAEIDEEFKDLVKPLPKRTRMRNKQAVPPATRESQ